MNYNGAFNKKIKKQKIARNDQNKLIFSKLIYCYRMNKTKYLLILLIVRFYKMNRKNKKNKSRNCRILLSNIKTNYWQLVKRNMKLNGV